MDRARFEESVYRTVGKSYERDRVGLLAEKSMHAVLKDYFEPDHAFHEHKISGFFADIFKDGHITEIQTHNLCALKKKLDAFLPLYPVTVVHPITATGYLVWMDPKTGDCTPKRKLSHRGCFSDAGRELLSLRQYIGHPNLEIRLLLIDTEEYRLQSGRTANGKRHGAKKCEKYPLALRDELILRTRADYAALCPSGLPSPFTAAQFRKASGTWVPTAGALLALLRFIGTVRQTGKKGRAYLYEKSDC